MWYEDIDKFLNALKSRNIGSRRKKKNKMSK